MRLVLVNQPAAEPLSAAEVKARLNIGGEIADDVISAFVTAARQTIDGGDGWLGRALITQTWKLVLDGFPGCCTDRGWRSGGDDPAAIRIPLPPLQEVTGITYVNASGVTQPVDPGDYQTLLGTPAAIVPAFGKVWPAPRRARPSVEVTFRCGYGDAGTSVPEPIRTAIVLMVSNLRSLTAQNLFLSEDTVEGMGTQRFVVGGNAQAAIDAAVNALLIPYRVFA